MAWIAPTGSMPPPVFDGSKRRASASAAGRAWPRVTVPMVSQSPVTGATRSSRGRSGGPAAARRPSTSRSGPGGVRTPNRTVRSPRR